MRQKFLRNFLSEFSELDTKFLEIYGFKLLKLDANNFRWIRDNASISVSLNRMESLLTLKLEWNEGGETTFASLEAVYHSMGGRGALVSNQYSRPRTITEIQLKRMQWLVLLEKIEHVLLDAATFERVIKDSSRSTLIWPPPTLRSNFLEQRREKR